MWQIGEIKMIFSRGISVTYLPVLLEQKETKKIKQKLMKIVTCEE